MATRLYWHNALFDTAVYPGSYPINQNGGTAPTVQAHLAPLNYNVLDATSVHRSMDTQKGTLEVTKTMTSLATTLSETYYWTKFISPPMTGTTSITANTWGLVYALAESNLSANFIGPIIYVYVWRPSNGTRIGWINDQVNPADITEPAAINSERLKKTTFPGSLVSSVVDGDVIIWELCSRLTQAAGTAYQDTFYFDGTNDYPSGSTGNVVTDMASYIETPQNISFIPAVITASTDNKTVLKPRPVIEV